MNRRQIRRDIENDIREHIEIETRENIERGMPPAEARAAALRKFGNPALIAEQTRAVWRWAWLDRVFQDSRYALRSLRRNPLFAAAAILTLTLGIGLNTAVFSVVSAVLIKPLPYPNPERVVWIALYVPRFKIEAAGSPDYVDWRAGARSLDAIAAYTEGDSTLQYGDDSEKHSSVSVTPDFWNIAGARPALGRLFTASDPSAVVLTWRLFTERFAANPRVLNQPVRVDGRSMTIVGVLPKDFRLLTPNRLGAYIGGEPGFFSSLTFTADQQVRGPTSLQIQILGRLKPGVSFDAARADLLRVRAVSLDQSGVNAIKGNKNLSQSDADLRIIPLQERLVGQSRNALLILLAAVGFVFLIACANLGNLLLARASARQREVAVRIAIGAGRRRLLRQFLVEGLVIAALGGATGLVLAAAGDWILLRIHPTAVPRLSEVAIDWRVALFALGASVLAGAIFGLAPALSISPAALFTALQEGGRGSAGAAGLQVRRILVAAQLALALVLLTGAGLMIKSLARMYDHPPAFQPDRIAILKIFLSGPGYRDSHPEARSAYIDRLLRDAARIPGVTAVAVTNDEGIAIFNLIGSQRFAPGHAPPTIIRSVSAAYPAVVGLPLVAGRWTTDDEPGNAVIVNQTFARLFGDPIDRKFRLEKYFTIVGVTGDLKISRLDAEPPPEVLMPFKFQIPFLRSFNLLVKTSLPASTILPSLRKTVQAIDPTQPPYGIETLEDAMSESIAPHRFHLLLLGTFAASAVGLALIGIYGVMAFAVAQRTREIGVRMALGAKPGEVAAMVVRQGMTVAGAGIVIGIGAALVLTRLMASLLFEVKPNDPIIFTLVTAALTVAALAASWLPATQAARVDPTVALRHE